MTSGYCVSIWIVTRPSHSAVRMHGWRWSCCVSESGSSAGFETGWYSLGGYIPGSATHPQACIDRKGKEGSHSVGVSVMLVGVVCH